MYSISSEKIVQGACGKSHSLALTCKGEIITFGRNVY